MQIQMLSPILSFFGTIFYNIFSLCTSKNFNSAIAGVAAHVEAFGQGFKTSFMCRKSFHLSFATRWQHKAEHVPVAFDDRYAWMNGTWVVKPPPPPPEWEPETE